jgi:hypothetical protein
VKKKEKSFPTDRPLEFLLSVFGSFNQTISTAWVSSFFQQALLAVDTLRK